MDSFKSKKPKQTQQIKSKPPHNTNHITNPQLSESHYMNQSTALSMTMGMPLSEKILMLHRLFGNQAVSHLVGTDGHEHNTVSEQSQDEVDNTNLTYPKRLLRFGNQGEDVKTVQKLLNRHGYNLAEDGIFGSLTYGAVVIFQQVQKLLVDGIVGPNTWMALISSGGDSDQPNNIVSPEYCQALAESFMAAGQEVIQQNPSSSALVMFIIQKVTAQLLNPSLTESQTMSYKLMSTHSSNQVKLPQTVEGVKDGLAIFLDLLVNDMIVMPGDPIPWKVEFLYLTDNNVTKLPPSSNPDIQHEVKLFLVRVRALLVFYNSLLPEGSVYKKNILSETKTQKRPTDPQRLRLVGNALADIGKIRAKEFKLEKNQVLVWGWDTTKIRYGHKYLKTVFDKAWTNHKSDGIYDNDFKYERKDKGVISDGLPSWCGVIVTSWIKKVDPSFPDWVISRGITKNLVQREKKKLPEVGDIIIRSDKQHHHEIISWIDSNFVPVRRNNNTIQNLEQLKFCTVAGNTGDNPTDYNAGKILEKPSQLGVNDSVYEPWAPSMPLS